MKDYLKISALSIFLFAPFLAQAHGYWIELKGSGKTNEPVQVQVFFGEYAHGKRERGATLDKMADIKITVVGPDGEKTTVATTQTNTHWEGSFTPQKVGYYQVLGVNDTRDVQDWTKRNMGIVRPVQFLRADYVVGEAADRTVSPQQLDVVARAEGNTVGLRALRDGKGLANSSVNVVNPEGWERRCQTNEQGRTSFAANQKGIYIVELEWIDKTPGTFNGKPYEQTRYRCDMTQVVQ